MGHVDATVRESVFPPVNQVLRKGFQRSSTVD